MEDLILCTICIRALKGIEKQEKEIVSTQPKVNRQHYEYTKILHTLYAM